MSKEIPLRTATADEFPKIKEDAIVAQFRLPVTAESYDEVRETWKRHSIAEDARDIAGLMSTLTTDCVYELVQTGHRWEGHAGATRFYMELLGAFPDVVFSLSDIVIGPQGVCEMADVTGTHLGNWLGGAPTGKPVQWKVVIFFPLGSRGSSLQRRKGVVTQRGRGDAEHPDGSSMKRSWIDALVGWGTSRRVPWWVLLGAFWFVQALSVSAVKWWDGSLEVGHAFERTADTFFAVAALAGYGLLNRTARRSFDAFRPALDVTDEEAHRYRHRLSTLSPRAATFAALGAAAIGLGAAMADPVVIDFLTTSVASTLVIGFVNYILSGIFVGPFMVQLVRQLRLVARLHRLAARIDLLRPEPAHAFARLTALGGVLVLVLVVYSMLTDPTTLTNPVWASVGAVSIILALGAFVVPLRGMQKRLKAEKQSLLDGSANRFDAVTADLHRMVDDRAYKSVAEVRGVLDALDQDRRRIKSASTLPWETATLRGFATALVVPVAIWFVTAVLGKTLGF